MLDLICVSHLRWDFVWQRPQHLLSRFGKQYRIFFVEEPIAVEADQTARLEIRQEPNNVTVVRMLQPMKEPRWIGHNDPLTMVRYEILLKEYLKQAGVKNPVMWLYTPMAWHFADTIPHQLLIYDVMDELSAFKGANTKLRDYDKKMLSKADIVFTGGLSLYQSRRESNPHTYLFPSGVEIEHFATAAKRSSYACPEELAALKSPILGYFGVIDERMDLQLLAVMAEARPDWQIVLIGPTAKIAPEELPQAPNLHYLGMKNYKELPAYLAYFDVALVPFAINEATRYLSPTKTLEYMAAHKPIVSTPIRDIEALYSGVVRIAGSCEDFITQVEAALQSDPAERRAKEHQLLEKYTWDGIVQRMQQLIENKLEKKPVRAQEEAHEVSKWA